MLRPPRYLEWARRHYGKVPFDLASSGIAAVAPGELGAPALDLGADAHQRLRHAIARFNGVSADEVSPALGATHALWLAYASLVSPGDEVLIEAPGYEPVWHLAEAAGAKVVRFGRPFDRAFAVDPEEVVREMTPRTRLIVVTSPHNPSGLRVPDEVLLRLASLARSNGALLLVDEVYAPLDQMAPGSAVWGRSARRLGEAVVAVGSLTKAFGLGVERIGWVLAPPEVALRADGAILAACGALPLGHAAFGAWAFSRIAELSARAAALTQGKREIVRAWVKERPDLIWSDPPGGLFGFAVRPGAGDLLPAVEAGLAKEGVLVAAGTFFGVPDGFRLSWTIPSDRIGEGLGRLARVLDSNPTRPHC